ncbi:hypothetical protein Ddye_029305 [Dipteronia dyeriana]|uniref:Uncharacterized protein n=1 Tax=Dipteronia dyeriana TaxID=168575 RepID=A0AAD9TEW1_9ROSI|nr:hypothetical protein Ddye_029305 [Dipteronia dyeriana]
MMRDLELNDDNLKEVKDELSKNEEAFKVERVKVNKLEEGNKKLIIEIESVKVENGTLWKKIEDMSNKNKKLVLQVRYFLFLGRRQQQPGRPGGTNRPRVLIKKVRALPK